MAITQMSDEQIARMQRHRFGHNPVVDFLFGGVARGVIVTNGVAAGAIGPLPIRVYRPNRPAAGPLPLVVNFHGGGWTLGSLDQADWLCSNVAATVGAIVVSVDYRLAPSQRWPAAARTAMRHSSTSQPGPRSSAPTLSGWRSWVIAREATSRPSFP